MKFLGLDPILAPIPVRPVAHYSMGGIEADIDGRTKVENIWAAGEVACHSLHGANRLGCNSTAECLAWGAITGREIAEVPGGRIPAPPPLPEAAVREEEARIFKGLLGRDAAARRAENPYTIRRELRDVMDRHAGVFRDGESMQRGARQGPRARPSASRRSRSRTRAASTTPTWSTRSRPRTCWSWPRSC